MYKEKANIGPKFAVVHLLITVCWSEKERENDALSEDARVQNQVP